MDNKAEVALAIEAFKIAYKLLRPLAERGVKQTENKIDDAILKFCDAIFKD